MNSDETRRFLDNAIEQFRSSSASPDSKLHSLWKISQLVEDATDEELYELASAAAVEEDHRLRGEICYTISRSRRPQLRPQLVGILKEMILDEDPYVRRSAMAALGELGEIRETMFAAIEQILDDVSRLRSTVVSLERKLTYLRDSTENFEDITAGTSVPSEGASPLGVLGGVRPLVSKPRGSAAFASRPSTSVAPSPAREIVMDDYMRCWETYLRHERDLLRDHRGKYVAIYEKEIIGIGEDEESLAEMIYEKYGLVEALICKIEEEDEPIRMPPPREIIK